MATVLITGTSKGIGYDASIQLARAGHKIIATMRNPSNSDLAEIATKESLPILIHQMDVDDTESVNQVFDVVGTPDVLINNAGILSYEALEEESLEKMQAVMNTNYFGAVRCTKAVLKGMRERKSGCIINIGSVAGTIAIGASVAYSASKFALESFSEILAQEIGIFGVRVHLVLPGIIDTPMATTELPMAREDSLYPNGRRVKALFAAAAGIDAPAAVVSDRLQMLIESNDTRLRHPVGPDALIFLGYRASVGDERFISTWGAADDGVFLANTASDMMMDLSTFLDKPK